MNKTEEKFKFAILFCNVMRDFNSKELYYSYV